MSLSQFPLHSSKRRYTRKNSKPVGRDIENNRVQNTENGGCKDLQTQEQQLQWLQHSSSKQSKQLLLQQNEQHHCSHCNGVGRVVGVRQQLKPVYCSTGIHEQPNAALLAVQPSAFVPTVTSAVLY
jgi:hypothetical protein